MIRESFGKRRSKGESMTFLAVSFVRGYEETVHCYDVHYLRVITTQNMLQVEQHKLEVEQSILLSSDPLVLLLEQEALHDILDASEVGLGQGILPVTVVVAFLVGMEYFAEIVVSFPLV